MNSNVTQQDLADSYLPSFQACVEEGAVSGIMCSYNAVNGEPSCANEWLLGTLLRESWQFDGYVTSDCDAEGDAAMKTRYPDANDAVAAILHAGTDIDCGLGTTAFMKDNAAAAIRAGAIAEADIDVVLRRLFRVRLRLGHFDPPSALDGIGAESVCNADAMELARDGARQSVVLAKNVAHPLPLDAAKYSRVVVIGRALNAHRCARPLRQQLRP